MKGPGTLTWQLCGAVLVLTIYCSIVGELIELLAKQGHELHMAGKEEEEENGSGLDQASDLQIYIKLHGLNCRTLVMHCWQTFILPPTALLPCSSRHCFSAFVLHSNCYVRYWIISLL